jgi:hypothetical protein
MPFEDNSRSREAVLHYNTVIMVDNAIQVFDMAEQIRIDPEKHVDEQLEAVRADIAARRHYIQPATQEEIDFYEGYMANPAFDLHPRLDNPLQSELAFRRLIDSPGDGWGYLHVSPAGPPTGLPRMALCPCLCRRPGGCCHRREDGPPEGD